MTMTPLTRAILRYRSAGTFYNSVETTLAAVARESAGEVIATRIDSDMLDRGISFELIVGTLRISSEAPVTGEPYDALDAALTMLDSLAVMIVNQMEG